MVGRRLRSDQFFKFYFLDSTPIGAPSDTYTNTNTNANAYTYTNADAYTYASPDKYTHTNTNW